MKRNILTVLFLVAASIMVAQEAGSPTESNPYRTLKHEVGLGVIGAGDVDVAQMFRPVPGLYYRYFLPNGAIRVLAGGTYNSYSDGYYSGQSETYGYVVRVGYQYHVPIGRWMPRIGADISGGMFHDQYGDPSFDYYKSESMAIGLSPNIGLDFWISPKLSIGIETRFDISYIESTNESGYPGDEWAEPYYYNGTSKGINTTIGPIALFACGFHF